MNCYECENTIEDYKPFQYGNFDFCTLCMSALCSWFLDGGIDKDPEMFGYVLDEVAA